VAAIQLSSSPPSPGTTYLAVGIARDFAPVISTMTAMRRRSHIANDFLTPMHRVVNEETVSFDKSAKYLGGVVIDETTGEAVSLYSTIASPKGASDV